MRITEDETPDGPARALERPSLIGPREVLRLQRTVGNRAVGRPLRAPQRLQRPMQHEKGGKADEPWRGPGGSAFDRTLTIFTPIDGPQGGRAIQVAYRDKELGEEELRTAKPEDFSTSVEVLARGSARTTVCNVRSGDSPATSTAARGRSRAAR